MAWLGRAALGLALGVITFLGVARVLLALLPAPELNGSCDGGLCLLDPRFWFEASGSLLLAVIGGGLAALAVLSCFTLVTLFRLKAARAPQPAQR